MTRTAEDLVRVEVHYCVSSLVSTLASSDYNHDADDLGSLMDQALELALPIPDYEEAAVQAGWTLRDGALWHTTENMMFGGVDSNGAPCWRN